VLPWSNPALRFKNIQRHTERIASNLQLGSEVPFAGKEIGELTGLDHLLDDRCCLSGQVLAVRKAGHYLNLTGLLTKPSSFDFEKVESGYLIQREWNHSI
jgi:hypothetical protein